jgi:hypothetical protein
MQAEQKAYEETVIKAKLELHAAQSARALEATAANRKAEAERVARETKQRARLLASLTDEEKHAQALLARISKADPHGHNAQNAELAQWRGELSKTLRRFEILRQMEAVVEEERERIAAHPKTRTFAMRFADPSDYAIVMVDAVETHHRVTNGIDHDGGPERWRVPALCFESADRIDVVRGVLEDEETRRRAMGLVPAKFAVVLSPEEWRDPVVVARAAGVEPSDGRDVFCGAWLGTVTNDERVTAAWVEGRTGPFADAIERAAIAAANTRPHVEPLSAGLAYWKRLAKNAAPVETGDGPTGTAREHDAPDHEAPHAAQEVTS